MGLIDKIKRIELKRCIDGKQGDINFDFELNGLTDELLDKQVKLNIKRHEENISDDNEKIHKRFVQ